MTLTVYLLVQQPAYDSFWVLGSVREKKNKKQQLEKAAIIPPAFR